MDWVLCHNHYIYFPLGARSLARWPRAGSHRFFEGLATEHLLGQGILPEHLNEHKIGRVMDKLYEFGLSELFLLIALAAAKKYQINLDFSHEEFKFFFSSWSIQSSAIETVGIPVTRVRGRTNTHYHNSWLFERSSTRFKTIYFRLNRHRRW